MQAVGEALGRPHEAGGADVLADADQNPLAGRPGARDRIGLHMRQKLLIDAVGGPAQRKFTQGREVARREIMRERALGLAGNIDLAVLEPLDEIVRRQIDQFDRVGLIEHRIRHGLADADVGDLRDDVVQALDVLDVDGGVDVDAVAQQLGDVEIALGMTTAGRVGVRQFVDQRQCRLAGDQRIDVHLLEHLPAMLDQAQRDAVEAGEQRPCLGAAMGLDHADHDVHAGFQSCVRALQHLIGLADARRGADENFQPADLVVGAARGREQRLGRGSVFGVAARLRHTAS